MMMITGKVTVLNIYDTDDLDDHHSYSFFSGRTGC